MNKPFQLIQKIQFSLMERYLYQPFRIQLWAFHRSIATSELRQGLSDDLYELPVMGHIKAQIKATIPLKYQIKGAVQVEIYQKFQSGVVIASYLMRHNQIITITSWVSFFVLRFTNFAIASLAPSSHHHIENPIVLHLYKNIFRI